MKKNRLQILLLLQLLMVAVFAMPVYGEEIIELEVGYEALEEYMFIQLESDYTYSVSDTDIVYIKDNILYAKDFGDCILYKEDGQGHKVEIEVIVYWVGDEPIPWGDVKIERPYAVGYPDQTFRAMDYITRAEVATMFSVLLDLREESPREYADVSKTHWANPYIKRILHEDLLSPRTEDHFDPDSNLTRSEMAELISAYAYRMGFFLNDESKTQLVDVTFNHTAFQSIHQMINYDLMDCMDNSFRPDDFIHRGEATQIINKIIGRECLNQENQFTDLEMTNIYYKEIIAACKNR